MRGIGRVYDLFWAEDDFQDDEVALVHEKTPPYRAGSEPLVHLRAAAAHLRDHGAIAPSDHDSIIADLKSRWYGDRSLPLFHELVLSAVPTADRDAVRADLKDFSRFRWKSLDLSDFLAAAPWRQPDNRNPLSLDR